MPDYFRKGDVVFYQASAYEKRKGLVIKKNNRKQVKWLDGSGRIALDRLIHDLAKRHLLLRKETNP